MLVIIKIKRKNFRIIDHTADIGVTAYGTDVKQAFANAAKGMFSLITDLRKVRETTFKDILVTATDRETLLVAWLNELIYLFDVENLLCKKFNIIELGDTQLKAKVYGEKVDNTRHLIKIGIKSTTYHMLQVKHDDGYEVRVIFDI